MTRLGNEDQFEALRPLDALRADKRLVEREIATGPSLPDPAHQIDGVRFGMLAGDGDAAGEAENQDSD
jgi:hypothetical protein